jgi:hypothetical protein
MRGDKFETFLDERIIMVRLGQGGTRRGRRDMAAAIPALLRSLFLTLLQVLCVVFLLCLFHIQEVKCDHGLYEGGSRFDIYFQFVFESVCRVKFWFTVNRARMFSPESCRRKGRAIY